MKLNIILGLIIVSSLLIGCVGTDPEITTFNPYKGSDGITMELLNNAPPKEVYEQDSFNIVVKLHNQGAYDVVSNPKDSSKNEYAYFRIIYDNFYFEMADPNAQAQTVYKQELTGKDPFDHYGQFELQDFLLKSKTIVGQRESPTTKILFNLCFPYNTLLTEDVCLDRDPFGLDIRDKPCTAKPITLRSQGAPIAITKIDPRMPTKVAVDDKGNNITLVAPTFAITLKNVGGGNVIMKLDNKIDDQCVVKNTDQKYWGKIKVSARLGNKNLTCTPENVSFNNREAVTNCRLQPKSGDVDKNGFMPILQVSQPDILIINTSYVYTISEGRDIKINRGTTLP